MAMRGDLASPPQIRVVGPRRPWAKDGATLTATASASIALLLVWKLPGMRLDFAYDWLVARATAAAIDPYQTLGTLAGHFGISSELDFIAPRAPGALVAQLPLAALPSSWSYMAGRLLVVASLAALLVIAARLTSRRPAHFLIALPVLLVMWPFAGALYTGNTGILVAALIGWTWIRRSGVPLGVAVTIKLWPWLLVPALAIAGRRRAAFQAAATFALLNGAGLLLPHVSLEGAVGSILQAHTYTAGRTLSLFVYPIWASVALGVAYLGLMWRFRWSVTWSIPVALLTTPLLWPHYLPVLLIPAAVLMRRLVGITAWPSLWTADPDREAQRSRRQPASTSRRNLPV